MLVVTTGSEEVQELLDQLPNTVFIEARNAIGKAVFNAHSKVSSYSGGLKNRTGRLKRSLVTSVAGTKINTLVGSVSTDIKYAPIQEKGGTIKAKNKYLRVPGGPYLNIPLSANKTRAGVTREGAREVFSKGGYIIKSKKGNYIVMSFNNKPMFVLKKSVTIPARLNMIKAGVDQVPTLLSDLNGLLGSLK